jgi:hypothetical protein
VTISLVIESTFHEVLESAGARLLLPLTADAVLLETGMDSLGFAILIARLEQAIGYDPFVLMDEPVYPRTYGQFVGIYERFASHRRQ